MNMIPQKRKNVSYVLKLVVILSAAVGTVMSAVAGRNSFMGGSKVFMYFTIQSNIAIAVICAFGGLLLLRNKEIRKVWYIVKLAGTVSITLTGVVFVVLLTPVLRDKAWNIQNALTHVVVPAAAIADFFVTASGRQIKRKNVVYVIIPPMLYAIYAGIGYLKGWEFARSQNYPYFFLNWGSPAGAFGFSKELPYDPEYDGYVANIIIFSAFRGKGYGAEGLELLCAAAKENGITVLYDDIAVDNPAVRLFLRHGFYEDHRTEEKIILKKDL